MYSMKLLLMIVLVFEFCHSANDKDFDPYRVLGLSRSATEKDIRQAYKKLAKHWHPDKNSDPNAHEQFTKINAAYEILSDSTKRQEYDEYGTTSQEKQRGFNTNHFRDPFDIFRAHFGEEFHSFHGSSSGAKKIIHSRELLSNILPNSNKKPYVLYGSTAFCFHCRQSLSVFRAMEQQLNDVGIGTGEFNVNDPRISNELGIISAPALCVISQGRVYHFNDYGKNNAYTESNIKEFVRQSIPIRRYIKTLNNIDDVLSFINSYNQSNRAQVLLLTRQKSPTLKFVLPCLQYSTRIRCALLNSTVINQDQTLPFLRQISTYSDTIFLFKDDSNPKSILRENDVSYENVRKLFENNQLLDLPTMTNSDVFNLACEKNSAKPCFLIIGNSQLFFNSRSILLNLAQRLSGKYSSKMIFIDTSTDRQSAFQKIFSSIYRGTEKKLFILVSRRWLDETIEFVDTQIEFDENSLEKFQRNQIQMTADIEENLKLFLNMRWQNAKKFRLPTIVDLDHRQENILHFFIDFMQNKWNYWIERNPILRSLSSYFFFYQFWLFVVPILIYLFYSRQDPESSSKTQRKSNETSTESSRRNDENQFESTSNVGIEEFDHSFLQRHTRPGATNVIVLLLIADRPNDPCIGFFARQIASIKDSRMVFAILYRQRSSRWLNELYANIEADQNKPIVRCTSSTVLALYIRRKFFIPYWSLTNHQELSDESAAFMGMDQHQYRSSSTSSNDSIASSCDSLTFSDWIDLLLDGTLRNSISVTEWPMVFS